MTTHGASLPGTTSPGQDRWTATPNGLIVLDGATAIAPGVPPAEQYVDALLDALRTGLTSTADLRTVIADAVAIVSAKLDLAPGDGPSSTVALLRWADSGVDAAVLGDSTIVLGTRDGQQARLCDDRLAAVAAAQRQAYRQRLEQGNGYDDTHRQLLVDIQRIERQARNEDHGYWIAEAVSDAGHHATVRRFAADELRWAVLATDGAQRAVDHLHVPWPDIAAKGDDDLLALLRDLHRWEAEQDPDGRALPRAKRHDDKTVSTWRPDRA
ncbi:MAG: protein phosphatase 2C domain-containing protein [Pseudonocardia sp.]|nr:protein phosphatase 2C domain-containing protein [Pseudonocardia sp.]